MKLSIVTIHLNDFPGLQLTFNTLGSVLGDASLEWVVIDGGSDLDDGGYVVDRLKSSADHFVSEPDGGIYDAMNKGTRLATGDYVLFLNAGDELHSGFKPKKLTSLAAEARPDMIWGCCQERYENGSLIQVKTRTPAWAWYGMPAYHPSIFFLREAMGDVPYDTSYRIAADYDLVCRLLSGGGKVMQLDTPVSIFRRGGVSDKQGDVSREEENAIRLKYFPIPKFVAHTIKHIKGLNARIARVMWLRRLWRRWV